MAKPNSYGKKPGSNQPEHNNTDQPDAALYGHVQALNALDMAASLASKSAALQSLASISDVQSETSSARTLSSSGTDMTARAAITPNAVTYPSTSISKVYQHWADGDAAKGGLPEWNNNILSDGKSDYFEGEVVPHVYFYKASNNTPLVTGQSYSFNVTYNYYQSNTNAGGFVYMTSPNADRTPTSFAGGTALPDSTFTNGGGMQGAFNTVYADITAVSGVTYTGSNGSSSDGKVTITFTYTGPTTTSGGAEIQYGLLIAAPGDVPNQGKGLTDGANAWTGGSLQTTVDINGSGATSIQLAPSAIIVGEISGMKFSDVDGNGVRDADGVDNLLGTGDDEVGLANWTIFLDKDNDGQLDAGEDFVLTGADGKYALSVVPDADRSDPDNDPYIVREVQKSGWMQTTANPAPITITALDPMETNVNFGNMEIKPSLNIVKEATVPGGTANFAGEVISYTITVENTGNQTLTGVTVVDPFISNLDLVINDASADGELDVGETWNYTASHVVLQSEIDSGANIVNVATADSEQSDPDTDDAFVPVSQNPALNIVKEATVPGGTANFTGEVISYTITVENTGNQTLTGVTVVDPFISDLDLVINDASADGELDVGETWNYTASHVVLQSEIDSGANIVNVATADSEQSDPDTDDAFVPVSQNPALNIVKEATVPGGTANFAGEVISYTITVENTGNQTLTGVTVVDPFISDLDLVINDASADGELDVGETWNYTASHVVLQSEIDSGANIVNVATADSEQSDPDTDDAFVPVSQNPALNIVKEATVPGGTANFAGEVISYTITVENTGNQTLTGVTMVDPFISNLDLVINDASADGELDVGETWNYTASHVVLQSEIDAGANIVNVATADSEQSDPDTDDASVPVSQNPALNIVKEATVPGGTANFAGEVISYTITVENTGNQTLTGVTVVDPFISDLDLVINDASADGELDVGETWNYTASHIVLQSEIDAGANIVNVATADSEQSDPNTDDAFVPVSQNPALNIVKEATVPGGTANFAGEVISYTITVENTGNQTLTGVTVVDPFISDLELVINDASADGELDVGETWNYTASHVVTQQEMNSGLNIVNLATADSIESDPDTDDAFVPVSQNPALNIVKEATVPGGTANFAGEVISYTITVENTGNQTLTGVTVVDPFISDLELVINDASADGELDVGETWNYTASHVVTQQEMNSGLNIVNLATADSIESDPDTDDAFVPVFQAPAIAIDKAIVGVNGGNGNGTVDALNDVIRYAVTVTNTGNITLTNVTVNDPFTNLTVSGVTLAPGASETYLTSYTIVQSDLDTNGGGDGFIENTATADSFETAPVSDTESIEIYAIKALYINKKLDSITNGNENGVADAVGDILNYKVTVTNLGAITLTNVTVVDPSTGLNESGFNLSPGESKTFDTFYTLQQSDLDNNGGGDGYIDNVATADSDQTVPNSDNESTPLLRTVGLGVEKNVVGITGGALFVDAANQIITYEIKVYNAGTVTLTGVTVTDELTGMNETILELAPGETVTYETLYKVTQADLNNNGGGDGDIDNITVADSDQTTSTSDGETVELLASPLLFINKTFQSVTEGNGNNLVDAVDDKLNYRIFVANVGNVTLTDVSVYEPLTNLTLTGLTLEPNQIFSYDTSYLLTQDDLDNNGLGDGYIDNIVLADSAQTPEKSDTESVPILRSIAMSFDKEFVDVTGGNNNGLADRAGEQLNFSFTVTNQGTVTLTNVTVKDEMTGLNELLASLKPGDSAEFTSSYTLQQSDLDTNGDGDGRVENTATADSDQTIAVLDIEGVTVIYDAQIDLTKYVSIDNGDSWEDANTLTGPILSSSAGINPIFKYTALNDGTVTLKDVTFTDVNYDLNGIAEGEAFYWGDLAPGTLAEFTIEVPFMAGQNSGNATVTATALTSVLDIDNAYYLGV